MKRMIKEGGGGELPKPNHFQTAHASVAVSILRSVAVCVCLVIYGRRPDH